MIGHVGEVAVEDRARWNKARQTTCSPLAMEEAAAARATGVRRPRPSMEVGARSEVASHDYEAWNQECITWGWGCREGNVVRVGVEGAAVLWALS